MPTSIQSDLQPTIPNQTNLQRPQTGKIQVPSQDKTQVQLNVSIVQASMEVSISSKDQPMQLLFKNVITNLNEVLQPQFGPDAIQNAVNQDNSPEGTAGRIASLSTNLLGAFEAQHPEEDPATAVKNFMDLIRQGIDQGFKEAKDILQGMGALQGDVADNIDKTYDLVQQKLSDFQTKMLGPSTGTSS